MVRIFFGCHLVLLLLLTLIGHAQLSIIPDSAQTKITLNDGSGDSLFFGTRNMRMVLKNILYRGGANNFHLKPIDPKKYNQNPLTLSAIDHLHQAGFEKAVYLYEKNFSTLYPNNRLDSLKRKGFIYECRPKWEYAEIQEFHKELYKKIMHPPYQPIYIHCWNGWHQSGLVSAVTLMQFCDLNPYQALAYWEENTDQNHKGFSAVKKKILLFEKNPNLLIPEETKKQICPCLSKKVMTAERTEEMILLEKEGNKGAEEFMEKKASPK